MAITQNSLVPRSPVARRLVRSLHRFTRFGKRGQAAATEVLTKAIFDFDGPMSATEAEDFLHRAERAAAHAEREDSHGRYRSNTSKTISEVGRVKKTYSRQIVVKRLAGRKKSSG